MVLVRPEGGQGVQGLHLPAGLGPLGGVFQDGVALFYQGLDGFLVSVQLFLG